jgi:hypothetical protein
MCKMSMRQQFVEVLVVLGRVDKLAMTFPKRFTGQSHGLLLVQNIRMTAVRHSTLRVPITEMRTAQQHKAQLLRKSTISSPAA